MPNTYLIWSEVSYTLRADDRLRDGEGRHHLEGAEATRRPRQSTCVDYPRRLLPQAIARRSRKSRPRSPAIGRDKEKAARSAAFRLVTGKLPESGRGRLSGSALSRQRGDCPPKTCLSGDRPRSRRRSSGLRRSVPQAGAFDGADVNEHVIAAVVGLDESVALGCVKPLHGSHAHGSSPFSDILVVTHVSWAVRSNFWKGRQRLNRVHRWIANASGRKSITRHIMRKQASKQS